MEIFDDKYWMRLALREAEKALEQKEVPVGCLIVHENKIIGRGYNQREMLNDCFGSTRLFVFYFASIPSEFSCGS